VSLECAHGLESGWGRPTGPPPNPTERWFTRTQVAAMFHYRHPAAVSRLVREGKLPEPFERNGQLVWAESQIRFYLRQRLRRIGPA
jgi:hypothetical protein